MPSPYQLLSLQAVLTMFWELQRVGLPEQCVIKSPAALSRFFNEYGWPTKSVIRATRKQALEELLKYAPIGKRSHLQVIIDLTTLEKRVYLSFSSVDSPDWKKAALLILQQLLPKTAVNLLLIEIESKRKLLVSQGLSFELVSIQI